MEIRSQADPVRREPSSRFCLLWGLVLVTATNLTCFSTDQSPPWDAVDQTWLALRWLGAAGRAGFVGDWFPHIYSGLPLGGNWETGVWNPLYRFVAVALPDSILSLNLLYLVTQLGLFVVTFLLGMELLDEPVPSMAFGLAIVGCGFVVGHASHFSYLQSLLGFLAVALGFAKGWRNQPFHGATWCGVGTFHILTAGYPQIVLFGLQLEAVAVVLLFWKGDRTVRRAIAICAGGVLAGLVLAAPSILGFFFQFFQWERSEGLDVEVVMAGSLPPLALGNFFDPFLPMQGNLYGIDRGLYRGAFDVTMDRFHLLLLSPWMILVALVIPGNPRSRRMALWSTVAGVVCGLLAFGDASPLPVRRWLAESLFLYRVGRFPSGEHSVFASAFLALSASVGLAALLRWGGRRRWLVWAAALAVSLDFVAVMQANRFTRFQPLPGILAGGVERIRVVFGPDEQPAIDRPRNCEDRRIAERWARVVEGDLFYWDGLSPFVAETYLRERESMRWALCGPSRLWRMRSRRPHPWSLERYSPDEIVFRTRPPETAEDAVLLFADVDDGSWALEVDGSPAELGRAPAGLRLIDLRARAGRDDELTVRMFR